MVAWTRRDGVGDGVELGVVGAGVGCGNGDAVKQGDLPRNDWFPFGTFWGIASPRRVRSQSSYPSVSQSYADPFRGMLMYVRSVRRKVLHGRHVGRCCWVGVTRGNVVGDVVGCEVGDGYGIVECVGDSVVDVVWHFSYSSRLTSAGGMKKWQSNSKIQFVSNAAPIASVAIFRVGSGGKIAEPSRTETLRLPRCKTMCQPACLVCFSGSYDPSNRAMMTHVSSGVAPLRSCLELLRSA